MNLVLHTIPRKKDFDSHFFCLGGYVCDRARDLLPPHPVPSVLCVPSCLRTGTELRLPAVCLVQWRRLPSLRERCLFLEPVRWLGQ